MLHTSLGLTDVTATILIVEHCTIYTQSMDTMVRAVECLVCEELVTECLQIEGEVAMDREVGRVKGF